MIYLDNAATTRILDEVFAEMEPYLKEEFGNPGSKYSLGARSRSAVELARERVANLINASPENIVFTSSGSEANSLALGSIDYMWLSSCMEHDSVLNGNTNIIMLPYIREDRLCEEIEEHIRLDMYNGISFMYTNNELGLNNPVHEIGKICKDISRKIIYHTDCVQALGHEWIDVNEIGCDMLSMSAHKIHGPKGVGALYVRDKKDCTPIIHGSQEGGLRGGTENVAGIVGFGKACEIAARDLEINREKIKNLRRIFLDNLSCEYIENYHDEDSKIISIRFPGVDAETLILICASEQIYFSSGAACRNLESEPNKTLIAYGLTEEEAGETVRISLSPYISDNEIKHASKEVSKIVRDIGLCNK